jgi:hypothetical protein
MTKQVWTVVRGATDVTSQIQSMQYSTGRRTQFDSWSPGGLVLTIKNESNQADSYNLNDTIILTAVGSLNWSQSLYVQEVLYNDLGGDGAGSTATVICTDLLGRLGRIQVFEQSIGSQPTIQQIDTEFASLLPAGALFQFASNGDSVAAADGSYSGTALNRFNLNMVTEQGAINLFGEEIWLFSRSTVQNLAGYLVFNRDGSGIGSVLPYMDIRRIALGPNYLNTCTAIPSTAAQQNATNTAGVATYGTYGAEFSTVDNSQAQALSFAEWQVFSRDDPDELSFQISISDTPTSLTNFFDALYQNQLVVTVSYKKPGSATPVTTTQIIQGWSMSVNPSRTDIEVFTSPLTYTNFFTLDSDTFGVLDQSRLGW